MVVEVLMDTCRTVTPELPDRYRSITPCFYSSTVEHPTDNRSMEVRFFLEAPFSISVLIMDDDFKKAFWEWFDELPEKAKRSYQRSTIDVAEEYFREFFYKKVNAGVVVWELR